MFGSGTNPRDFHAFTMSSAGNVRIWEQLWAFPNNTCNKHVRLVWTSHVVRWHGFSVGCFVGQAGGQPAGT